jgi:hypothetical protein
MDTVARPKVLNVIQFNGKFGCLHCLHPGKTVSTGRHCYPCETYDLRSDELRLDQVKKSLKNKTPYQGVKGKAYLSKFLKIPNAIFLDSMHLCYLQLKG